MGHFRDEVALRDPVTREQRGLCVLPVADFERRWIVVLPICLNFCRAEILNGRNGHSSLKHCICLYTMGSHVPDDLINFINDRFLCRETQLLQLAALLRVSLHTISQRADTNTELANPAKPFHYTRPWCRGDREE